METLAAHVLEAAQRLSSAQPETIEKLLQASLDGLYSKVLPYDAQLQVEAAETSERFHAFTALLKQNLFHGIAAPAQPQLVAAVKALRFHALAQQLWRLCGVFTFAVYGRLYMPALERLFDIVTAMFTDGQVRSVANASAEKALKSMALPALQPQTLPTLSLAGGADGDNPDNPEGGPEEGDASEQQQQQQLDFTTALENWTTTGRRLACQGSAPTMLIAPMLLLLIVWVFFFSFWGTVRNLQAIPSMFQSRPRHIPRIIDADFAREVNERFVRDDTELRVSLFASVWARVTEGFGTGRDAAADLMSAAMQNLQSGMSAAAYHMLTNAATDFLLRVATAIYLAKLAVRLHNAMTAYARGFAEQAPATLADFSTQTADLMRAMQTTDVARSLNIVAELSRDVYGRLLRCSAIPQRADGPDPAPAQQSVLEQAREAAAKAQQAAAKAQQAAAKDATNARAARAAEAAEAAANVAAAEAAKIETVGSDEAASLALVAAQAAQGEAEAHAKTAEAIIQASIARARSTGRSRRGRQ